MANKIEFEKITFESNNLIKKDFLLTFIVPVYNTSKYLTLTLNSIGNFLSDYIELIIIDDGSEDNSSEVILNWIKSTKTKTIFIQQNNRGLSETRMTGIKYSTGKYIGFCDSDDFLNLNTYMKMARIAQEQNLDIAMCRSLVFDHNSGESYDFYDKDHWYKVLKEKDLKVTDTLSDPEILMMEPNANNRIIKKEFLIKNNISFPSNLFFEDVSVHFISYTKASKILLYNSTGYFYRVGRPGKITDSKSSKRFDVLNSIKLATDYSKKKSLTLEQKSSLLFYSCRIIFWCGSNTLNNEKVKFFKEACKLFQNEFEYDCYMYCCENLLENSQKLILSAFFTGNIDYLLKTSVFLKKSKFDILKLMMEKQFGIYPRKIAKTVFKDWIKDNIRKLRNKLKWRF